MRIVDSPPRPPRHIPGVNDNHVVSGAESAWSIPRIPISAGALIFDKAGRLLILKPTYKAGWTIPGGQIEDTGESPWQGCQRETLEECGLKIKRARLACVDFLRPREGRPGGARFLFDCGSFRDEQLTVIAIDGDEIDEHRFVETGRRRCAPKRPAAASGLGGCRQRALCLSRGGPAR